MPEDTLLQVRDLTKRFGVTKSLTHKKIGTILAVNDVTFSVRQGETLGLVGESGCGKTTTGRCIMRAIEPSAGTIVFHGSGNGGVDVTKAEPDVLRQLRLKMRMMFQDPYSSLNPRMTVFQICAEPLLVNGILRSKSEMRDRVSVMLEQVGLDPNYMTRYPHAFSGGQRQRIAVARSLILDPEFVVADEPVSALDVSIQAQILNLLQRIKRDLRLTYLFIAHNLAVIQHVSDRVAVMYMGKIVETADTDGLFERPLHPYSEALLSAVPITDPDATRNRIVLRGEVGNLLDPPGGCYFHPRCNYAQERCTREEPLLREIADKDGRTHIVACHFAEELTLRGIEE